MLAQPSAGGLGPKVSPLLTKPYSCCTIVVLPYYSVLLSTSRAFAARRAAARRRRAVVDLESLSSLISARIAFAFPTVV